MEPSANHRKISIESRTEDRGCDLNDMSTDRRRYFRVNDTVLIKYRVVEKDVCGCVKQPAQPGSVPVGSTRFALLGIDPRLREVIAAIRNEQPLVAEALNLLNRKIMLVERLIAIEANEGDNEGASEHEPMEISLSGGGAAITAGTPLPVSTYLVIDLVLLPMRYPMTVFGTVVDCSTMGDGNYRIAIKFDDMSDRDRDLLTQQVMRKQTDELKLARRRRSVGGDAA